MDMKKVFGFTVFADCLLFLPNQVRGKKCEIFFQKWQLIGRKTNIGLE